MNEYIICKHQRDLSTSQRRQRTMAALMAVAVASPTPAAFNTALVETTPRK